MPRVCPAALSACTWKKGSAVWTGIVVSKPLSATVPAWDSEPGLVPASTRQLATDVAPFQLA